MIGELLGQRATVGLTMSIYVSQFCVSISYSRTSRRGVTPNSSAKLAGVALHVSLTREPRSMWGKLRATLWETPWSYMPAYANCLSM